MRLSLWWIEMILGSWIKVIDIGIFIHWVLVRVVNSPNLTSSYSVHSGRKWLFFLYSFLKLKLSYKSVSSSRSVSELSIIPNDWTNKRINCVYQIWALYLPTNQHSFIGKQKLRRIGKKRGSSQLNQPTNGQKHIFTFCWAVHYSTLFGMASSQIGVSSGALSVR